jgi:MFS transporter, PHS family, inorganic phosphate transporter
MPWHAPRRHDHHVVPPGHRLLQPEPDPEGHLPSPTSDVNTLQEVFQISKAMFVVALFGTFPGYWVTVTLIDKMGR